MCVVYSLSYSGTVYVNTQSASVQYVCGLCVCMNAGLTVYVYVCVCARTGGGGGGGGGAIFPDDSSVENTINSLTASQLFP